MSYWRWCPSRYCSSSYSSSMGGSHSSVIIYHLFKFLAFFFESITCVFNFRSSVINFLLFFFFLFLIIICIFNTLHFCFSKHFFLFFFFFLFTKSVCSEFYLFFRHI